MAEEKLYPLRQMQIRLKVMDGEPIYGREAINCPEKAADAISQMLAGQDREYFCMCNLDVRGRPLNYHIVSVGSLSQCEVSIANIFKAAILSNASSIILFHCHPSGDPYPSEPDRQLTKTVIEAGKLMGITVNDHLIVGCGTGAFYSFYNEERDLFVGAKQNTYQRTSDEPPCFSKEANKKPSVLRELQELKNQRTKPAVKSRGHSEHEPLR